MLSNNIYELDIYLGFIFFVCRRIHIDMFTDKLIQADLTISKQQKSVYDLTYISKLTRYRRISRNCVERISLSCEESTVDANKLQILAAISSDPCSDRSV